VRGGDGHDLQVNFIPPKFFEFDCFIVLLYIELELCHRCCPWLCLNYYILPLVLSGGLTTK